jgi:hypothetical protein
VRQARGGADAAQGAAGSRAKEVLREGAGSEAGELAHDVTQACSTDAGRRL